LGLSSKDVDRFWVKVRKSAHGCWEWTASRFGGKGKRLYGQYSLTGRNGTSNQYAHRVSWEMANGPIPDGLSVLHKCDNGICVNPAHLFLGTHTDNMRDAASKHRLSVPRPKRHKVTTAQLAEIDACLASGETLQAVADRFGVSKTWVSLYARGLRRQYDRPAAVAETALTIAHDVAIAS